MPFLPLKLSRGKGPKLPKEEPYDSNLGPGGSSGPGSWSGYGTVIELNGDVRVRGRTHSQRR